MLYQGAKDPERVRSLANEVRILQDGRRTYEYDSEQLVDKYLNHPDVKVGQKSVAEMPRIKAYEAAS